MQGESRIKREDLLEQMDYAILYLLIENFSDIIFDFH
jgi:hypothetical protein